MDISERFALWLIDNDLDKAWLGAVTSHNFSSPTHLIIGAFHFGNAEHGSEYWHDVNKRWMDELDSEV
jgi:hypothetical protein